MSSSHKSLLMIEAFWQYGFLARALTAGLLMGLACGLLSPFVVLRGLSFSADGLAHASLGGLAVGLWLWQAGPAPTPASYAVAFLFTGLVALAMAWFSGRQRVRSDTAVGACYVAAFALGVVLLSVRKRYTGHLEDYFFGSLLAVTPVECVWLGVLALAAGAWIAAHWRWLGRWVFDEDLARAAGDHVGALRYGLILLVAATVVGSARVVGVLLVTAMLILPGAIGLLCAQRLRTALFVSVLAAMSAVSSGMLVSNAADVPPGAVTVLMVFGGFVAALARRHFRDRRRPHTAPATASPAPPR